MRQIADARLEHQRRRFMRPDAHRWWRCGAKRYQRFDPRFRRGRLAFDGKAWAESSQANESDREWRLELQRLQQKHAQLRYEWALLCDDLLRRKANFNPSQPRVPAGSEGAGRWTDDAQLTLIADKPGPDSGPPLDKPPAIPPARPSIPREKNAFLKAAAQWVARAARVARAVGPLRSFVAAYEALSWLDADRPYIEAYQDPPKTLEELQDAVSDPKSGYNIHHVVEQTPAEKEGFPRSVIDARENLVRIPTLKHWEINGWFSEKNYEEKYQGRPPREYLRGKDWEERRRVGLEALIIHGVLKP